MNLCLGLVLAAVSGAVALSYELLWYRAYSIALMARPQAFGVVLGGYLTGIAAGAWLAARWCRQRAPARIEHLLIRSFVLSSVAGLLVLPAFSRLMTTWRTWGGAMLLIAIGALFLGAVFPLLVQATGARDAHAGRAAARIYFANIAGATLGAVVTGFYLLDAFTMAGLSTVLALTGLLEAAVLVLAQRPSSSPVAWQGRGVRCAAIAGVGLAIVAAQDPLNRGLLERLFFRTGIWASPRFVRSIENRSGVIAVTERGELYGSGVFDGVYNTDLRERHRSQIHRAFALTAFHPAPRRILMIGLGTGSWARVLASMPSVTELVVVEINPGYVQLLADHPAVADLTRLQNVRIEIDDGRRWLQRNPKEQFDVIVANTVYHWRANATSLLSVEFLEIVRRHLTRGGLYYFNSTSEARVQKTGALTFPYAWRFAHLMAVSDATLELDLDDWQSTLFDREWMGVHGLDRSSADDVAFAANLVAEMRRELEPRDALLSRTAALQPITDDNMGTEWRQAR